MSITGGTKVCSASSKTTGTQVSANPEAAVASGVWLSVACVSDPVSGNGETTDHTVTDSQDNTYTRLYEYQQSNDVIVSLHISKLTTGLSTGDTITLTVGGGVDPKAFVAVKHTATGAPTKQTTGYDSNYDTGPAEVTLSGQTSREYLFLMATAAEWTTALFDGNDADYTNVGNDGTTGGAGGTNAAIQLDFRIATLTGDTCSTPLSTTGRWQAILAMIHESGGTSGLLSQMMMAE